MIKNYKMTIEYDGTDFCGWQVQPNERTVQGEIETVLAELFDQQIRIITAGRTDTGVHALGQVANFKIDTTIPLDGLLHGCNSLLPDDVVIKNIENVDDDFNARYSAKARSYQYIVSKNRVAIGRNYAYFVRAELDFEAMNNACSFIIGNHDFDAFCQMGSADLVHRKCTVHEAGWTQKDDHFYFDITANRFVHNMVRILTGTFLYVGRDKISADSVKEILESKDRTLAGPTVPPHGLFLKKIHYTEL